MEKLNQELVEENESLKRENQKLRKEKETLEIKLTATNLAKADEIKKIKEKYRTIIERKEKIISDLQSRLSSNAINTVPSKNYENLLNDEKLVAIKFILVDQQINHTIICNSQTIFHNIEDQLYEKFPVYKESDNLFMFNGHQINKCKSLLYFFEIGS